MARRATHTPAPSKHSDLEPTVTYENFCADGHTVNHAGLFITLCTPCGAWLLASTFITSGNLPSLCTMAVIVHTPHAAVDAHRSLNLGAAADVEFLYTCCTCQADSATVISAHTGRPASSPSWHAAQTPASAAHRCSHSARSNLSTEGPGNLYLVFARADLARVAQCM